MQMAMLMQFWIVAALLILTPGADWSYAIASGVRGQRVTPSVSGMLAGHGLLIVIVALGVGSLIAANPGVLTALTVFGGAYLVWLGVGALRAPAQPLAGSTGQPLAEATVQRATPAAAMATPRTALPASFAAPGAREFLKGLSVSGLNPKCLLLFLAILPQFVTPSGWPAPAQMLSLGGVHVVTCAAVYFGVALAARRLLASRPTAGAVVTKVAGGAMLLIGAGLLAEKLVPLLAG